LAPRNSLELAMLHDKEMQKGNAKRATLAVATEVCGLPHGGRPWTAGDPEIIQ